MRSVARAKPFVLSAALAERGPQSKDASFDTPGRCAAGLLRTNGSGAAA